VIGFTPGNGPTIENGNSLDGVVAYETVVKKKNIGKSD